MTLVPIDESFRELARFQDMLASLEIEGFAPRYFGEGC